MAYSAPQYDYLCNFNQSAVVDSSTSTVYCVDNYYYPQSLYYRRPVYWGPYNRPGWRRGPYHRRRHHRGGYRPRPRPRPRGGGGRSGGGRAPDYQ